MLLNLKELLDAEMVAINLETWMLDK